MSNVDLSDYVTVPERITQFKDKHPEGSLRVLDPNRPYTVETIGADTYLIVVAAAYRTPDDAAPGVGMAQELIPGRTPYTKGSELQNAETSAWGRAIVAALAADTKKGVASADEIRNRRTEEPERTPVQRARAELMRVASDVGLGADPATVAQAFAEASGADIREATAEQVQEFTQRLRDMDESARAEMASA